MQQRIKQRVTLSLTQEHWDALKAEAEEQLRSLDDEVSFNMTRWAKARVFELNAALAAAERARREAAERAETSRKADAPSVPGDFVSLGDAVHTTLPPEQWVELQALTKAGHVEPNEIDSGFHGVYRNGRKWRAIISAERGGHKERITVGTYDTPEEAAIARGRFLANEQRRTENEALRFEVENRTITRPALTTHPVYEAWLWHPVTSPGKPRPPCPFEPGVRYTVDKETQAVTRDEDGVVIIPPQQTRTSAS